MKYSDIEELLNRAEIEHQSGNYLLSDKLCNEILVLNSLNIETNDAITFRSRAFHILSSSLLSQRQTAQAFDTAQKSLELAIQSKNEQLEANVLMNIGRIYNSQYEYLPALEYFNKALILYQKLDRKIDVINALGVIGVLYEDQSEFPLAMEFYRKSLELAEELNIEKYMAWNFAHIGNVYMSISDYSNALDFYSKSLTIDERLNLQENVSRTVANIGIVYYYLSDINRSLEYSLRALAINEKLNRKEGIAANFGSIGIAYDSLSDYPKALEYYFKSLSVSEELDNQVTIARNYGNIGTTYLNIGNYSLALEYLQKAVSINKKLERIDSIIVNLSNIGSVYATVDFSGYSPEKAEEYLFNAINLAEVIDEKHSIFNNHKILANLYEHEGEITKALYHYKEYYTLESHVKSEDAVHQAELMESRRKIEESERDRQIKLARYQEQEKILHNILPSQIAERMLDGEKTIADTHKNVSVFFSDIVGFTKLSQKITAEELVGMLNGIFSQFDQLCRKHGLEKIKTIGDAYMAVSGAPTPQEHHAQSAALFALEVADMMKNYTTTTGERIDIRIGLHSGTVVVGIIGENKFSYDLWGDAVNTASRMESHGEPGKIHVSAEFVANINKSVRCNSSISFILDERRRGAFVERGEINIKGKGLMKTYFLEEIP